MRVPAPMRLGPSMVTPGPTVTSGASSTLAAMRALGSMGIEVLPPGQFQQIVIFQEIVAAALDGQGHSQRAFQKPGLQEIELPEGKKWTPAPLPREGAAAAAGHLPGGQPGVALLA